ncbi:histidine phosphatase family protein [Marinilongibacter aquaticus]|uniref:histidine phosphatase family protein n=1 Tax=Marinilongibacter aquaticus TaxID=2975157 RepID=UPI0021BD8D60|nr:histidine phosphatase family protein [Marinilongibacter aquaticus]UBM60255.1 histidine phosphatase family protein [Marinilongibacter aquaticus]
MSTKRLYIIRHGETDYNKRGIVQGSGIDADLNATGRAQARAFFEAYGHIPFQTVYTSELKRTHQSVQHFLELDIPHIILPGLNEISWGTKEGKVPNSLDDSNYYKLVEAWKQGDTHIPVEGGESPNQVAERQRGALKTILDNTEEELILVAMHGRAMRILLAQMSKLPLSEMDYFEHKNLCLYLVEYSYTEDSFSIVEHNNVEHLKSLTV